MLFISILVVLGYNIYLHKLMLQSYLRTFPWFKNQNYLKEDSNTLVFFKKKQKKTDREERDIFSMVLDRRIAYLRENSCPVLSECTFSFKKQDINEADTVVIAAKRLVCPQL